MTEAGTPKSFSSRAKVAWCFFIWAAPLGEASAATHRVGNFEEVLSEEALPAVDIDDALIEHQIGRSRRDRGLRNAFGCRFLLEVGEPRLEGGGVAAIGLTERRRRGSYQQHRQHSPSFS